MEDTHYLSLRSQHFHNMRLNESKYKVKFETKQNLCKIYFGILVTLRYYLRQRKSTVLLMTLQNVRSCTDKSVSTSEI